MHRSATSPHMSHNASGHPTREDSLSRRHSGRRRVQRVQDFVIYRKSLGAGSMGKVKLAKCLNDGLQKEYAVKIMPKLATKDRVDTRFVRDTKPSDPKDTPQEREKRTVREIAIMNLLRHPNICRQEQWVTQGDSYYLFLEYVDGGQLLDYIISHGRLREKQARSFARQIVSALDYCHRNSIVHRDLKIENILISSNEETIKIIDFGLSNIYSPSRLLNTFCGSLYFAAPELLHARKYTGPEVDVWSFGIVLYVLVCGRVPFDDTSLPALHQKIKAGVIDYPDHLSKDCVDLLSKILVVDPFKRETLTFVRKHPWMNKGYDEPVPNHLPHRRPLQSIEMDIVEDMAGFGFGPPEEICEKLEQIIATAEYQEAAAAVDQNFSRPIGAAVNNSSNNSLHALWRRSTASGNKRGSLVPDDDFHALPAMYDPLISIYSLVKEQKEQKERQQQHPVTEASKAASPSLSRSASTIITRPKAENSLQRRKTERVPRHQRDEIAPDDAFYCTATTTAAPQRPLRTSSSLLERSISVARRLGSLFPNLHATVDATIAEEDEVNDEANRRQTHSSSPLKRSISLLRSRSHSERRTPSVRCPPAATSDLTHEGRFLEEDVLGEMESNMPERPLSPTDEPKPAIPPTMGTYPKSQFHFNRRHLFCQSPQQLLTHLWQVLHDQNVRCEQPLSSEPFTLLCECECPEWTGNSEKSQTRFTLTIYHARWMGGRLGIKVHEVNSTSRHKGSHQKLYRRILSELGQRI